MGQRIARVQTTSEKQSDLTPTGGEVFPGGSLLEIVRDHSEAARPALLHWDGKHATVATEVVIRGRHYVPLEIDPSLWRFHQGAGTIIGRLHRGRTGSAGLLGDAVARSR